MLEKEIKVLIAKEEYDLLDKIFEWDDSYVQVNHYYTNTKSGDNNDITVRVREKKEKLYLQIKLPIKKENSLHIKKEIEEELDYLPEFISGKKLEELTKILKDNIYKIGELVTFRKIYHYNDEVLICLDKNQYLGVVDYEVEIEYTGEYPQEVIELFESNDIYTKNEIYGKYSRFLMEYNE